MNQLLPILSLLIGLAIGVAAAWLVLRAKGQHAYDRGKADSEGEQIALAERIKARDQTITAQNEKIQQFEAHAKESQTTETSLKTKLAQYATIIDQERKQSEEKLAVLNQAQQKLADAFKALAADALKGNSQSFSELAKATLEKYQESAKGDLDKRQQAINDLVKPVKESLDKVDTKINELEKARAGAYTGLTEQVRSLMETQKQLQSETGNLVKALRRPQVRGRWGEIQLKRVVEMAGMLDHCDFYEQQSTDTEDGRLRPDLLVRLPGIKNIVVDAKAPLSAYLDAIEAKDEETRTARLQDHARQVRDHITALGRKSYFEQFTPAPEFVVLFLPGEVFFSAALEYDPELIEMGVEQNVIIATPTTLIALLRAVAYGWRQEKLAENAKEISDLGKELYKRLANMGDHLAKLGKSLAGATDAYNRAVGSLETRVLITARKFKELGTTGLDDEIVELPPVEVTPRLLQAPEVAGGDDEADTHTGVANNPNRQLTTLTEASNQEPGAVKKEFTERLGSLQEENAQRLDQIRQEPAHQERENRIKDWAEKSLGGKVHVDESSPERRVIGVDLASTDVTDADLAHHLKELPDLQSLDLQNTNVTSVGLAHLNGSPNLKHLDLGNTLVTDADLQYVSALTQLTWLSLWNTQVSDNGLRHIERLTNLQWLDLSSTNVTDDGLACLTELSILHTLDLGHVAITDSGLANLKGLYNLHTLDLASTQVTDIGMEHVKALTNLQTLDLTRTQVTDLGLQHINKLPDLHLLSLRGTQVTDTGIVHLTALKTLRVLRVKHTKVSRDGIKKIQQALPNCKVQYGDIPSRRPSAIQSTERSRHRRSSKGNKRAQGKQPNVDKTRIAENVARGKAVKTVGKVWLDNQKTVHPSLDWTLETVKLLVDAECLSLKDISDWNLANFSVLARTLGIPLADVFKSQRVSDAVKQKSDPLLRYNRIVPP